MKYFTVEQIKDYILKNYPKSCLAVNYKNVTFTNEEIFIGCEHFFYFNKLHWCGCGEPGTARKVIKDFLTVFECKTWEEKEQKCQELFNVPDIYDNPLLLCLAYSIDAAGLTEHGSSIGGAWLTDEGKMYLDLLNEISDLDTFDEGSLL